uniref:Uncharacterized protein n=1 Tax=Strongyloides papillosus TaxID=174720 RepID=A0A0N5BZK3_STREA
MDNSPYILRYSKDTEFNGTAQNTSKYSKARENFKRHGTINGFNFKEANINLILENLNDLDCEKEDSKDLLRQIESMNDNDFERLIKTIKLENSKLKENIYLNHLLYHPQKITHECLMLHGNIPTEDKELFIYKKLLEEQEMLLRKENMRLHQQLETFEMFKNLKSASEELKNLPTN